MFSRVTGLQAPASTATRSNTSSWLAPRSGQRLRLPLRIANCELRVSGYPSVKLRYLKEGSSAVETVGKHCNLLDVYADSHAVDCDCRDSCRLGFFDAATSYHASLSGSLGGGMYQRSKLRNARRR